MGFSISLFVNGKTVIYNGSKNTPLLKFLRNELGLTGTKCGCAIGDCGSCMVIVDGQAQKSCLLVMGKLDGKNIETIENLAVNNLLHPIQEAFLSCGAIQCGFCTPGMIMSVKALLDKNHYPTESDIKEALKDNLCRCTGYKSIVEAVLLAAKKLRNEDIPPGWVQESAEFLGVSFPDHDGIAKVSGAYLFADDLRFDNMLYGALVLSEHPHARITGIETSEAAAFPGVVTILTHKDLPGKNSFGRMKSNQPVFASDKVRYVGDVIALVLAESQEIARQAAKKIVVGYRELPGVFDPVSALQPGSPQVHDEGNKLAHKLFQRGDTANAFALADVVVEKSYFTPFGEHGYLEPESGVALIDKEGILNIYYGSQLPFASRKQVAASLAISEEKIRNVGIPMGGGFGGKTDILLEIVLGLGAVKTGRPVKLTLTREESIRMSVKRHAFYMHYKTGATKEGKLVALEGKCLLDAGAYAGMSSAVGETAVYFGAGPYVWPNLHLEATTVYTNNVPGGAFRGFGINQVHLAVESQLDMMARQLGMDPIEFRLKNGLDIGERTAMGEVLRNGVGLKKTLHSVREALGPYYSMKNEAPGNKRIGIGVASGYKNVGYGRGYYERCGASISLKNNGRLELCVSVVDMGQGARTVMAQLASGITGVGYQYIDVITADTAFVADGVAAIGQRQTYLGGNAVQRAGEEFADKLKQFIGSLWQEDISNIEVQENQVVSKVSGKTLSLREVFESANVNKLEMRIDHLFVLPPTYPLKGDKSPSYKEYYDKYVERGEPASEKEYSNWAAYAYLTQAAIVEVDCSSGEVKLLAIIGAHDVGKTINPQKVQGQVEGSYVMGMGFALSEEFVLDHGRVITNRLKKLGIPMIGTIPEMVPIIVEEPVPDGPYGAKGASEVAMVPTAGAIVNAIYDAVGVRITSLPATKEKILKELRLKGIWEE